MVGFTCCVPGCQNNNKKDRHISFYVFPKDPKLREIWIENIAKPGKSLSSPFKPTNGHRVCSDHFEGGKKTYMINIPTIFPLQNGPETSKNYEELKEESQVEESSSSATSTECPKTNCSDSTFLLNKIREKEKLIQDLKERISKLEDEINCIKKKEKKKVSRN